MLKPQFFSNFKTSESFLSSLFKPLQFFLYSISFFSSDGSFKSQQRKEENHYKLHETGVDISKK